MLICPGSHYTYVIPTRDPEDEFVLGCQQCEKWEEAPRTWRPPARSYGWETPPGEMWV